MRKRTLKSLIFAIVAVMTIGLMLVGCGVPDQGGGETGGESGGSPSASVATKVTEAEYEAACGEVLLNNDYVCKLNGKEFVVASGNFVLVASSVSYYEKSGDAYYGYERKHGKYNKTDVTAETYESMRSMAASDYVGKYSQFAYDETQKAYVAETFAVDEEIVFSNAKLKFEDKKLVSRQPRFVGFFNRIVTPKKHRRRLRTTR